MSDFDGTLQRPTDAESAAAAGQMDARDTDTAPSTSGQPSETGSKGGLTEGQVIGREPLPPELEDGPE